MFATKIEDDIVIEVGSGCVDSLIDIPKHIENLPLEDLRYDPDIGEVVSPYDIDFFYIDMFGIKHIIPDKEKGWMAVSCQFKDQVYFDGYKWLKKTEEMIKKETIELMLRELEIHLTNVLIKEGILIDVLILDVYNKKTNILNQLKEEFVKARDNYPEFNLDDAKLRLSRYLLSFAKELRSEKSLFGEIYLER